MARLFCFRHNIGVTSSKTARFPAKSGASRKRPLQKRFDAVHRGRGEEGLGFDVVHGDAA